MKNCFILILLTNLLLGFSCKKDGTSVISDGALTKPAAAAGTDTISAYGFSVNGIALPMSSTVIVSPGSNQYVWSSPPNVNPEWGLVLGFSGSTTPVCASYSIKNVGTTTQLSSGECLFALAENYSGGNANTGTVTISPGNPNKINFTNILVINTYSNTSITSTVSGTLPFY